MRFLLMHKIFTTALAAGKPYNRPAGEGKAAPFGGCATTFAPVGSVSHDSQVADAPLRIVFPCHPAVRGHNNPCFALCHL